MQYDEMTFRFLSLLLNPQVQEFLDVLIDIISLKNDELAMISALQIDNSSVVDNFVP